MQTTNRDLAIFAALPVLEAAVRHNSFTKAAREFGLTQSALSRRIQGLERDLGIVLFARRGRSITLTEEGARLAEATQASLNLIETARHDLGSVLSGTVRIGVLPSLGSYWLTPRLQDFCDQHPDVHLRVEVIDADFREGHKDPVTWDPSSLDVVITRGHGGWRSLIATKLFGEEMVAVRSPDTQSQKRIGHSTRTGAWQAYLDVIPIDIDPAPTLVFEHFHMIIEAARAGAGIGLVPLPLVSSYLRKGDLITCGKSVPSGASYYSLASARSANRPSTAAFIKWLEGAAATE
jgi:LysR family glycine cleavage system transcriptional activator